MSNRLEINNTVEGEAWVVTFKNDPRPRAVVAMRKLEDGRMILKGEGYSNHIEASDHEMESAERIWPPLESDTKLDPLPYVALAPYERDVPEKVVTRGESRHDLERYERVYFRPREQYQQIEVYYLWENRLDPKPWRYALLGGDPSEQAREAEQVTGGFVFDPRPTFSQDKDRYDA